MYWPLQFQQTVFRTILYLRVTYQSNTTVCSLRGNKFIVMFNELLNQNDRSSTLWSKQLIKHTPISTTIYCRITTSYTVCNSYMFQPLKGHLHGIKLIHSISEIQQNEL
jgi:hypothetical protein